MIKIITDSTCDLPDELLKKYDITVVPLYLRFGMKTFKENVEISREEFYNKLALEKELPTTSQPSPGDFLKVYENIINKGDVIISLHISGKLSGTVNSAQNARIMILDENKSADITVIDSQSAGPGLGLIVVKAAQMAKEGF